MKNKYPECFPDDFEKLIIADGAGENLFTYYRISETGMINRDAFKGSFEKRISGGSSVFNRDLWRARQEELDIGDYSTSGYEKYKDVRNLLKCIKKYHHGPIIMVGRTEPECGLSMRTKDSRTRPKRNSHIDWWIYRDAHPELYFKKYIEDQEGE